MPGWLKTILSVLGSLIGLGNDTAFKQGQKAGIDAQSLADVNQVNKEALDAKSTDNAVANAPDGAAADDLRRNWTRD